MMRERLEEYESIARRKSCDRPYSLAVCSATYFSRFGAWVDYNGGGYLFKFLLGGSTP